MTSSSLKRSSSDHDIAMVPVEQLPPVQQSRLRFALEKMKFHFSLAWEKEKTWGDENELRKALWYANQITKEELDADPEYAPLFYFTRGEINFAFGAPSYKFAKVDFENFLGTGYTDPKIKAKVYNRLGLIEADGLRYRKAIDYYNNAINSDCTQIEPIMNLWHSFFRICTIQNGIAQFQNIALNDIILKGLAIVFPGWVKAYNLVGIDFSNNSNVSRNIIRDPKNLEVFFLSVQKVYVRNVGLDVKEAPPAICDFLKKTQTLTELDISGNNFDFKGCGQIAAGLIPSCPLKILKLKDQNRRWNMAGLSKSLETNKTLIEVELFELQENSTHKKNVEDALKRNADLYRKSRSSNSSYAQMMSTSLPRAPKEEKKLDQTAKSSGPSVVMDISKKSDQTVESSGPVPMDISSGPVAVDAFDLPWYQQPPKTWEVDDPRIGMLFSKS